MKQFVIFGLFCGVAVGLLASRTDGAERPNILLVLVDDVGREVLGCYGGMSYQTPEIDRLAAEGMRFTHAYVMPSCHPTRITLLTGQYPFQLGHPKWGTFPREAEDRTLARMLQRAGYATVVVGKWQLALLKDDLEQPYRMGFDEYCVYGWHEGPWYYQPYIWDNGKLREDISDRYGPDVICDYLVDFIERKQDQPFFAYYSMHLCHAETNDLEQPAPFGPHGRYDTFAEMVPKMDERIGRVVARLDELGLREKTLILFLSDNGTAHRNLISATDDDYIYEKVISRMGDRVIYGGKATLTDGGIRVPMIANWLGRIAPGRVCELLVDASDVLPSLVEVSGAVLPPGIEFTGRSIPAQLNGSPGSERRWVFAERRGDFCVRNRCWKLYGDGRFFDMENDPDEEQPQDVDALDRAGATAYGELREAIEALKYVPPRK